MPQMSPMNWMIISMLFLIFVIVFIPTHNNLQKNNNFVKPQIKTMKWKW